MGERKWRSHRAMHVVERRYDTIQHGRNWVWALPGARTARRSQRFARRRLLHQKSRRENLFSRGLYLMKVYVFLRFPEKNCGSCLLAMSLQQHWETTLTERKHLRPKWWGAGGLSPCLGVGDSVPKDVLTVALASNFDRRETPVTNTMGSRGLSPLAASPKNNACKAQALFLYAFCYLWYFSPDRILQAR